MWPPSKTTNRIRGTTRAIDIAARDLRMTMTPAERLLWRALRNQRLAGVHFRRQHPIGSFIVDFYCAKHHLVVEVDGEIHSSQADYDQARDQRLTEYGYRVLRFTNDDVLCNLPTVLQHITEAFLK